MTKKNDTLSYISKISREFVKREIEKHNAKLEHIRRTLAERAEGIANAIKYQKEGADWRRKKTIKECEDWMNSTNTPNYLHSDYLARAKESCDNAYTSKVSSALFGLKLNFETEVEVAEDGKLVVAKSVADEMLEKGAKSA